MVLSVVRGGVRGGPTNASLLPLLQAAGAGDRDAVAEILDAKCDVNEVDAEGCSSLILASKVWHAISLSARNPNRSRSRVKDSGFRVQGSGFRV
jgi:ankyrin repeat protein